MCQTCFAAGIGAYAQRPISNYSKKKEVLLRYMSSQMNDYLNDRRSSSRIVEKKVI